MPEKPSDWLYTTPSLEFPVVTPQPQGYAPVALWALRQEGFNPTTAVCDDGYAYGDLLADAWEQGGFVLVEHDIAPWWGAVRELWECKHDWCVFPYPQGSGCPDAALGCSKYSDELVVQFPRLHYEFRAATWDTVSERLLHALWNSGRHWHEHWPPVAHARQREG